MARAARPPCSCYRWLYITNCCCSIIGSSIEPSSSAQGTEHVGLELVVDAMRSGLCGRGRERILTRHYYKERSGRLLSFLNPSALVVVDVVTGDCANCSLMLPPPHSADGPCFVTICLLLAVAELNGKSVYKVPQ